MSPSSGFTSKTAQQSIIIQLKSCWLLQQTNIWKTTSGKSIQCHITQEENWVKVLNTFQDPFFLLRFPFTFSVPRYSHFYEFASVKLRENEKYKNKRKGEKSDTSATLASNKIQNIMDQPSHEVQIVWQAWMKSDSLSKCWAPCVGPLRLISLQDQDPMRWERGKHCKKNKKW